MSRLKGRKALVTGAAKRIGRALALAIAEEGADIVVHYHHSEAEAYALAAEIRGKGVRAWVERGDLSDPRQTLELFRRADDQALGLDIVVNSASIFPKSTIHTFTSEDLDLNHRVHAMAPLILGRELHKQARAAGKRGDIINLLDSRILDYDRDHAAYHLSKRSLATLTRMMALEFAPTVRVNAVAPGLILPPPGEDDSYLERMASTNPLQTHGSPQEVAAAAVYLLTSQFVCGQILYVDGGRHMKGRVYD